MGQEIRQKGKLLKNVGQLAAALGVPECFIKRMKWAGFLMPGGRSTVGWALAWLEENPSFRQTDWLKPRRGDERPQEQAAGK